MYPAQRSKDVTCGNTIRRVSADPAVQARTAAVGEREAPMIYAEAGLWYDALSRLIERHPGDAEPHAERAALLEQVSLPDAALYDRAGSRYSLGHTRFPSPSRWRRSKHVIEKGIVALETVLI